MFSFVTDFIDGGIANWDVSNVMVMCSMFMNATLFNDDLSQWDVSSVDSMTEMFSDVSSFKRIVCGDVWIGLRTAKTNMFTGSSGSTPDTTEGM